jgi:Tfp pilus assembly ATPase PilU
LDQALANADSANNLRLKIKLAGLSVDEEPRVDSPKKESIQPALGFRLRDN